MDNKNKFVGAVKAVLKSEENSTFTQNGMEAYKSSLDPFVDLIFKGPGCRDNDTTMEDLVTKAFEANPDYTLKLLFYLRDVRGGKVGQGERKIFRTGLRKFVTLAGEDKVINSGFVELIPEYGRWDDLFCLFDISDKFDKYIILIISRQLIKDIEAYTNKEYSKISLLAKWLPSHKTGSKKSKGRALAKKIYKTIGFTEKMYRTILTNLRREIKILETYLSNKDYSFDYSKLPSQAKAKHSSANGVFLRSDKDRYTKFIEDAAAGRVKTNVSTLYPYQIVRSVRYLNRYSSSFKVQETQLETDWKALPDYVETTRSFIPVIDTSGSMYCGNDLLPIDTAVGVGLYLAERNKGIFKNTYITFSDYPNLVEVDASKSLKDRVELTTINCANTDFVKVFELILNAAIKHNLSNEDLPEAIVVISDMQFDAANRSSHSSNKILEIVNTMFQDKGYTAPKLIFWNAQQVGTQVSPVTINDAGVVLMSGCKPGMIDLCLKATRLQDIVEDIVNHDRYRQIRYVEKV